MLEVSVAPTKRPGLPRWALRGIAVAILCAAAKALLVILRLSDGSGRTLVSPWTPIAFLYQDMMVALGFCAVDLTARAILRRFRRATPWLERGAFAAYGGLAVYVAINIPVARISSTPLTYSMIAATRTELADSIRIFVTAGNVACVAALLALAVVLPGWLSRARAPRWPAAAGLAAAGIGLMLAGPTARARVESVGLHRNALVALVTTTAAEGRDAGAAAWSAAASIEPLPAEGNALDLSRFAGAARGRNVIWVLLESTGARYLSPYGAERDPMPRLSAFAARSMLFENAYAAYPMSIKGLFSMLCSGGPAAQTSAEHYTAARIPCPSIADRFKAAGYRTALVHSGRFVYLGMRGVVEGRGFDKLMDAGDIGGQYASSFGVDEPSSVKSSLAFVDSLSKGERFFLMYLPIAGHHPYHSPGEGPRPFGEAEPIDAYASDLYRGDLALGELIDGIAARGLERETLWVFVGDHGEAFYQHEGNFAHALFLYEENVHVPLMVVAPGLIEEPLRAAQVGSVIDIAPTLLDMVGLPIPRAYQGRSLVSSSSPGVARFMADQVLFQTGLRVGPWKFILDMESGREKLFDLRVDRGEQKNLAAEHPEEVRRFAAHLRAWQARERAWVMNYPEVAPSGDLASLQLHQNRSLQARMRSVNPRPTSF
jgi:arylsulfatase A-like enzyme